MNHTSILFDVGANDGTSLYHRINADSIIHAFEPTPRMAQLIREHTANFPNYHVHEVAVSDFNGTAQFNISGYEDWGCSSLLNYSEELESHWGSRRFEVTEVINVNVIRLDTFIEQHKIDRIDYFHCDTQGSDLRVLKGMGEYVSLIQHGCVEAAAKPNVLYKDQNSLSDTVDFLKSMGFLITSINPNDGGVNEVNVGFRNNNAV